MATGLHQVLFVQFPILIVIVQTLPFPSQPTPGMKYINCNASEECWHRGQLPNTDGVCFEPLSSFPCGEGYWFILNEATDNLQGHCVQKLCPEGLLPLEGACVEEANARAFKCAGGPVFLNAAGQLECGEVPSSFHRLQALVKCWPPLTPPITPARPTAVWTGDVQCAKDNNGLCIREVVMDTKDEINADDIHES